MASASPREQMQNVAQSATEGVRSSLTEQKDTAASSLGSFAGALRKAARESDGGAEGTATRMAEWAADGLERVSSTLRTKDLNGMVRELFPSLGFQRLDQSEEGVVYALDVASAALPPHFIAEQSGEDR